MRSVGAILSAYSLAKYEPVAVEVTAVAPGLNSLDLRTPAYDWGRMSHFILESPDRYAIIYLFSGFLDIEGGQPLTLNFKVDNSWFSTEVKPTDA